MRLLPALFVSLLFLVASCEKSATDRLMDEAENIMAQYPDSAFVMISDVDFQLLTDREKPRYALLLTMAQDRNYLLPKDDSLINIAGAYYPIGTKNRAIADYYSGRIKLRNGEYSEAVGKLIDAEESALAIGNSYWLGFIYRELAYLFYDVKDAHDEAIYSEKEYEAFVKTGDSLLIKFGALDYGRAEVRFNHNLAKGIEILDTVLLMSAAEEPLNRFLRAEVYRSEMLVGLFSRRVSDSLKMSLNELRINGFREYFPDGFFRNDLIGGVDVYKTAHLMGNGTSLLFISEPYWGEIFRLLNKAGLNLYYRESEVGEDLRLSYPDYEGYRVAYNPQEVGAILARRDLRIAEKERNDRRKINVVFIVITVVTAGLAGLMIWRELKGRYKRRRLVEEATELREVLRLKDGSISELQHYLDSIYGDRFTMLEELCDMFILPSKHVSEQKRIFDDVKKIVDNFKSDGKRLSEIDEYVNRYRHNVIIDFEKEFPGLTERDYILFRYLAAGFSRRAIAFLMDESVGVASNCKSRLKKRVAKSDAANREAYLEVLS